jgi:hypothetical protein
MRRSGDETIKYGAKVERVVELVAIGERQAKVNQIEAEALATALASLSDIPSACLMYGSTLIVKFTDAHGPYVVVRRLSALELRALVRFPGILQDPRKAIETLATAVMAVEPSEESEKWQLRLNTLTLDGEGMTGQSSHAHLPVETVSQPHLIGRERAPEGYAYPVWSLAVAAIGPAWGVSERDLSADACARACGRQAGQRPR